MNWKKKLAKAELKHIKDTTERGTLAEFWRNRAAQVKEEETGGLVQCYVCRHISRKLKAEDPAQEHDPEKCGCKYLGFDLWDCGHIDNLEQWPKGK